MSFYLQKNQIPSGGLDFDVLPACLANELIPDEDSYDTVKTLRTKIDLTLIQDSCCHSFQDCTDGIIVLRI